MNQSYQADFSQGCSLFKLEILSVFPQTLFPCWAAGTAATKSVHYALKSLQLWKLHTRLRWGHQLIFEIAVCTDCRFCPPSLTLVQTEGMITAFSDSLECTYGNLSIVLRQTYPRSCQLCHANTSANFLKLYSFCGTGIISRRSKLAHVFSVIQIPKTRRG